MGVAENAALAEELAKAYEELIEQQKRLRELRSRLQPEPVEDHILKTGDGEAISLSSLFGQKDDLIVVHNMGKRCAYCTLWADGFNGVYRHLEDRAAFVVVSHDPPEVMRKFAEGRDWRFRILSNDSGTFTKAMGYESKQGDPWPGVSTFHRKSDGTIQRVAHAPFGPGDDFCATWHLFDLLKDGPNDWQPKFEYKS